MQLWLLIQGPDSERRRIGISTSQMNFANFKIRRINLDRSIQKGHSAWIVCIYNLQHEDQDCQNFICTENLVCIFIPTVKILFWLTLFFNEICIPSPQINPMSLKSLSKQPCGSWHSSWSEADLRAEKLVRISQPKTVTS